MSGLASLFSTAASLLAKTACFRKRLRTRNGQTRHVMCQTLATLALLNDLASSGSWAQQTAKPSWIPTGKLNAAREYHTATLLPDGGVLVIGGRARESGFNGDWEAGPYSSAEIYDPSTLLWRSTGSLSVARSHHTATLLPTGQVLVAGGMARATSAIEAETRSAELYDPATGRWRPTANLITPRAGHTATLLPNGRVLIVGGARSTELYDPATETWSTTGATSIDSYPHVTTLLPDGKVLAIGNYGGAKVAELYDSATGTWSTTASPPVFCCAERGALLASGEVLVTDGDRSQLFDPATGEWRATSGSTPAGTLTLLANGLVLGTGGRNGDNSVAAADIYDPAAGKWSPTTALNRNRAGHSATLLPSSRVLVVGGFDGVCCDSRYTLDVPELFDPGLPQSGTVTSVSAASYNIMGLAREAIVTGFGTSLATASAHAASLPPPTDLAATTVKVKDGAGVERLAPLLFVSPGQVIYQIPAGTAAGTATVTITSGEGTVSSGRSVIHTVAPSLFTANGDGQGAAAAVLRRLRADGSLVDEPVAAFNPEQNRFVPLPINLGAENDRILLILSGSGIRFRSSLAAVIATIGGAYAEVIFAEAQPGAVGMDQVAVLLPRSLAGRGELDVLLTVDAKTANPVRINIK